MRLAKLFHTDVTSFLRRTGLSFFLLAAVLGAGCREVPGSCSRTTDNLCLAFQLVEPAAVPTTLRLTLSAAGHAPRVQDWNADPILAERAYILEVAVSDPSIEQLDIDCAGLISTQGPVSEMVVATGSKSVQRSTAERPTVILLTANGTGDMSGPADLSTSDLRMTPADMKMPPQDGPTSSDGASGTDL